VKLTVPAKALADALQYVSAAIATRPPEPILRGIHVDTTSGELVVSAFNYDLALRATVDAADVVQPGVAVIPGKVFAAVASKMHGNVLLTAGHDGPGATILGLGEPGGKKRKQPEYVLDTMPVDSYPKLDGWFSHDTTASMSSETLAAMFQSVSHAAARDDTVPQLAAVQLLSEDGKLQLTTTDRYRMARRYSGYQGAFGEALVPAKVFGAIVKGLYAEVRLGHTTNILTVATARRRASVRTLDKDFPNVMALVEKFPPKWASKFSRIDMIDALDRLIAIRDNDNEPVQLLITEDLIELRSSGGNSQTGSEYVPCTTDVGDAPDPLPFDVRLNPAYLLEALKAHGVDHIEIGSGSAAETKPLHIKGDGGMTSLLMPTRPSNR
jgi:DNA polymerase-3 subunit beta